MYNNQPDNEVTQCTVSAKSVDNCFGTLSCLTGWSFFVTAMTTSLAAAPYLAGAGCVCGAFCCCSTAKGTITFIRNNTPLAGEREQQPILPQSQRMGYSSTNNS